MEKYDEKGLFELLGHLQEGGNQKLVGALGGENLYVPFTRGHTSIKVTSKEPIEEGDFLEKSPLSIFSRLEDFYDGE